MSISKMKQIDQILRPVARSQENLYGHGSGGVTRANSIVSAELRSGIQLWLNPPERCEHPVMDLM